MAPSTDGSNMLRDLPLIPSVLGFSFRESKTRILAGTSNKIESYTHVRFFKMDPLRPRDDNSTSRESRTYRFSSVSTLSTSGANTIQTKRRSDNSMTNTLSLGPAPFSLTISELPPSPPYYFEPILPSTTFPRLQKTPASPLTVSWATGLLLRWDHHRNMGICRISQGPGREPLTFGMRQFLLISAWLWTHTALHLRGPCWCYVQQSLTSLRWYGKCTVRNMFKISGIRSFYLYQSITLWSSLSSPPPFQPRWPRHYRKLPHSGHYNFLALEVPYIQCVTHWWCFQ